MFFMPLAAVSTAISRANGARMSMSLMLIISLLSTAATIYFDTVQYNYLQTNTFLTLSDKTDHDFFFFFFFSFFFANTVHDTAILLELGTTLMLLCM